MLLTGIGLARKVPELCVCSRHLVYVFAYPSGALQPAIQSRSCQRARSTDGQPPKQGRGCDLGHLTASRWTLGLQRCQRVYEQCVERLSPIPYTNLTADGPFTRVFPSAPPTPSSPQRRSMALASENRFSIPHPTAPGNSPVYIDEQHTHDTDGGGNTTDEEGLGRGVGKGWLGELEG